MGPPSTRVPIVHAQGQGIDAVARHDGTKPPTISCILKTTTFSTRRARSVPGSLDQDVGLLAAPSRRETAAGNANEKKTAEAQTLRFRRTDLTCSTVSLVCDCHCRRRREVIPTYSSRQPRSELSLSHTYRGNARSLSGRSADAGPSNSVLLHHLLQPIVRSDLFRQAGYSCHGANHAPWAFYD